MNYEKIISRIFTILGIAGLYSIFESKFNTIPQKIILEYHGIRKDISFNCVSFDNFRRQIEYAERKYNIVSLEKLCDSIAGLPGKSENLISVTFDDAYANIHAFAYPWLEKMSVPFTVFVPAIFAGKTNIYDKNIKGYEEMDIMSYACMKKMNPCLVSFGSHGLTHRPLKKMELKELREEVYKSKYLLEEGIDRKVNLFCYPYGGKNDFDERAVNVIKESGFICACSTIWGRFNSIKTLYALRRVEIKPTDSIQDFILKLEGGCDWKRIKHEVRILLSKAVSC